MLNVFDAAICTTVFLVLISAVSFLLALGLLLMHVCMTV